MTALRSPAPRSHACLIAALPLLLACWGLGCAGAEPPPVSALAPAAGAPSTPAPRAKVKQLTRGGVQRVVKAGFGRFLQSVSFDDRPAMRDGKFLGFRVAELRGDLEACELEPGDVITRVNGSSIEKPDEALEVFKALATAKELVVDYERGGKAAKLVLPIREDGAAAAP